jgi:hypothetical protein
VLAACWPFVLNQTKLDIKKKEKRKLKAGRRKPIRSMTRSLLMQKYLRNLSPNHPYLIIYEL